MAGISRSPYLACFTLNDTNAHQLSQILTGADGAVSFPPATANLPKFATVPRAQFLVLGNDIGNGGAKLYVGNESLSTTFFGYRIPAANFIPFYSMDANIINLNDVWVLTDTTPAIVTVALITR